MKANIVNVTRRVTDDSAGGFDIEQPLPKWTGVTTHDDEVGLPTGSSGVDHVVNGQAPAYQRLGFHRVRHELPDPSGEFLLGELRLFAIRDSTSPAVEARGPADFDDMKNNDFRAA